MSWPFEKPPAAISKVLILITYFKTVVRGNVFLCCEKLGYDWLYVLYVTQKCGYCLMTCWNDQNDNQKSLSTFREWIRKACRNFERRPRIFRVCTLLCIAPIIPCCTMQKILELLVTEAESLHQLLWLKIWCMWKDFGVHHFDSGIVNDFGSGLQGGSRFDK